MKGFGDQNKSKKKNNKKIKDSKEQIIKQAIQFHSQGNISEAAKYYQYFINQGFNDHKVFSNYGVILKDLGKLQEAEISTRKAIKLNPNYADAHLNLGNILNDLGKLKEAELAYHKTIEIKPDYAEVYLNLGILLNNIGKLKEAESSTRKAIELKPDFAMAYSSLGTILRDLGNLKEAEISTRKVIELKPNFADAHFNLGNILSALNNLQEAFDSYLKAIDINPNNSNVYTLITRFLRDSDPSQLNKSKLKNILNLLLERNDVNHRELTSVFNFVYRNEIIINLEKSTLDFSDKGLLLNDKVIINALKKITFSDVKLEKLLTKVRRNISDRHAQNIETINYSELQFIIALGTQCFLNEYVYSFTEEENIYANTIVQRCSDGELNETNIAILSCYFPLFKLLKKIPSLKSFDSSNQSLKELIELQITEPLKEIELSKNIKKLGTMNDYISQKVKSQYEANPYPRWRYGNQSEIKKKSTMQAINNDINPNSINHNIGNRQLKVLIAGCGTGQHILNTQRYKNSQITGIDLSLSSLSYAQRKINELKIDNVELIQVDILEVALLERKFDIIESSGVLHHMNNPSQGLKALLGVLNNNGFLKLGLYSELARQNIVEARNYISRKKLEANDDNIRHFRKQVISGDLTDLNSLKAFRDFYSISECRDLCFHAQEHRFTIKQLQETLKSNELEFLGFFLPKRVKSLYKKYFSEDKKQTNLQNWAKFEEKHPNTFKGMYQFWVSKKEN